MLPPSLLHLLLLQLLLPLLTLLMLVPLLLLRLLHLWLLLRGLWLLTRSHPMPTSAGAQYQRSRSCVESACFAVEG